MDNNVNVPYHIVMISLSKSNIYSPKCFLSLNNHCAKFQCNVMLISVFKMMLKI